MLLSLLFILFTDKLYIDSHSEHINQHELLTAAAADRAFNKYYCPFNVKYKQLVNIKLTCMRDE